MTVLIADVNECVLTADMNECVLTADVNECVLIADVNDCFDCRYEWVCFDCSCEWVCFDWRYECVLIADVNECVLTADVNDCFDCRYEWVCFDCSCERVCFDWRYECVLIADVNECVFTADMNKHVLIADVNECESARSNQCGHECHDTLTSYKCVCNSGYRLMTDRHHCRGENWILKAERGREVVGWGGEWGVCFEGWGCYGIGLGGGGGERGEGGLLVVWCSKGSWPNGWMCCNLVTKYDFLKLLSLIFSFFLKHVFLYSGFIFMFRKYIASLEISMINATCMLFKHLWHICPSVRLISPLHNSPVSGYKYFPSIEYACLRVIISSWLLDMVFPQTFIVIFPEI